MNHDWLLGADVILVRMISSISLIRSCCNWVNNCPTGVLVEFLVMNSWAHVLAPDHRLVMSAHFHRYTLWHIGLQC